MTWLKPDPVLTTPSTSLAAMVAMRSTAVSVMTRRPLCPEAGRLPSSSFDRASVKGVSASATASAKELSEVDLTVVVSTDEVADDAQDERDEEPEETSGCCGDPEKKAREEADGGSGHVCLLGRR